jgi:outer membrane protein OmpA-like peptidoglycan-associated protein
MGNQLRSLDGSLIEVRGIAAAGQERANAAYQKAEDTNGRLTRLWDSRYKRSTVETVDVRFGFNRSELADAAQNELAGLAKEVKENDKLVVELAGYTDPVGRREYNVQLSQRRVEAVRRFFVEHGVQLWRIESVGLGPSGDPGLSNDKKRRVTVTLLTLE